MDTIAWTTATYGEFTAHEAVIGGARVFYGQTPTTAAFGAIHKNLPGGLRLRFTRDLTIAERAAGYLAAHATKFAA